MVSVAPRSSARARDDRLTRPRTRTAKEQRLTVLVRLYWGRATTNLDGWRRAPSRIDRIVGLLARLPTRARGNTCALPRATTARRKRLRALIFLRYRVDRPRISTARRGRPAALVLDLLAGLVLVCEALGEAVDARRLVVRHLPVITVTYPTR